MPRHIRTSLSRLYKINSDCDEIEVWAAWKFNFVDFTMLLRPHNASTNILLRLYHDYSATSVRLSLSDYTLFSLVFTTTIQWFVRLQRDPSRFYCDYCTLLPRSYYDHTTFIPRSDYAVSNNVNIVLHINIVPFLLFINNK